ncbi:hypothetical protein TTHERM_00309920 (macronuclear) [Tetrahymena thermophila SB210]|uniref:EGF-like domain-containing protein n=1 Tax=Tetrahymena thermophila (strain SB210) TaxID=312017 RepID=I7MFZ4_TETTS|nr:hypothetical protein TTHERM_00309920 [Tetrahymena thermophila SB210]EAS00823.2 hypothetical protein TTHERM_00309920 [Tetrahymena thermophila SB210]|eukprot:XP_001021068.2 hypothetical protein TTHERM_00309920 [Tetrahymena thermophila SB210]
MTETCQSAKFFYFLTILNLILTVTADPDILPIQVDGNVYQIQEQSAIVYKKLPEDKWRYSTYDLSGSITQTYILNGFQDLAQSLYFIEQNNFLNFYTQNNLNFQIIDLTKLTSQKPDYLQINSVILNSQCTQVNMIRKYGSYYFYICSNPKIFFYEQSIAQLQASKASQSYSQLDMTQDYIMLYPYVLCYKGNIFTKFVSLPYTIYKLIDLNYDLFLLDYSTFCIANLAVDTQTFSCKYSYFVGSDKTNLILTKVFESNRKQLIFTRILDKKSSLYIKYEVFDVTNLQMINRGFSSFEDNTNSQTIIQYQNIMYPSKGYVWNIAYAPQTNSVIGYEKTVTQNHEYLLVNEPFYNLNFQQGYTIFLNKDKSANYLLDIRDAMNFNCVSGQHIQLDFTCSNSNCPSFSYLDNSKNKCYCDSNAVYSPQANSCTCSYGFTQSADSKSCICQTGYYVSQGQCLKCNAGCLTCNGPLSTNCLTCQTGKYLFQDNSCLTCDQSGQIQQGSQCICKSNYYQNGNQCSQCSSSCKTCNGPNLNNCLTCIDGLYLHPDNSCQSCDTNGYFIQGQKCVLCSANCQTCDGSSYNNCLTCKTGLYLFENKSCNNCDTNNRYFIDGINCKQCNSQCQSCKGNQPTDCLTCPSGKYMFADNSCNKCDTLNKFYIDGLKCLQCNPQCYNCQGPLPTNCLTCPAGKYLFIDKSCSNCDTLNGFFIKDNLCIKCHPQCSNCLGSLHTNCTSCPKDKYLFPDNSCQFCNILNGYFISGIKCLKCNAQCSNCQGPLETDCLTCPKGKYLFADNSCQNCNTKNGFFISGMKCLKCNALCQSCKGPLPTDCLTCPLGKYLQSDRSCQDCDTFNGYFIDGMKCIKCFGKCSSCSGPLPNDCLTCPVGKFLLPDYSCQYCNTQDGFFIRNTKCIPCNPGCKTCKGPLITDCLTCPDQKYLFTDNTCRTCLTSKGYFKKNIQCLPCDKACQTCFGENKNQCLSCNENSQLFQNLCEQQYDTYHSNYFNDQKIKQTSQQFQTGIQVSFASTIISSILLTTISSSSFSLVANGLNSQKVSFHILIDTKLPAQIYKVLIQFKSQFPSMQYKYLNAYESILDQSDTQFQDSRYKLVNLSFNILQKIK